jgi:hypothetical protein
MHIEVENTSRKIRVHQDDTSLVVRDASNDESWRQKTPQEAP